MLFCAVLAVTSPSKSGEVRARALYDFVAEREEELSLKVRPFVSFFENQPLIRPVMWLLLWMTRTLTDGGKR